MIKPCSPSMTAQSNFALLRMVLASAVDGKLQDEDERYQQLDSFGLPPCAAVRERAVECAGVRSRDHTYVSQKPRDLRCAMLVLRAVAVAAAMA